MIHPDCARPCIYWKDGCTAGHTPPENPYAQCLWCNTKPKEQAAPQEAETLKLF